MEVKFWPKKHIDVEICDIWHDKDAVIVQHTDTLQSETAWYVEALGFKYGIRPTAFVWPYSGVTGLGSIYDSGVMKFGVYAPTDYYMGEDGVSKTLPDYGATSVSANGAAYYGIPQGTVKPSGYPNQGQELFDFTNGVKGHDVINGVSGSEGNMDFKRLSEYIRAWYFDKFGRYPSGGADRQGKTGSREVWPQYYLALRNTIADGNTSYGTSKNGGFLGSPDQSEDRLAYIEKNLTSRWEYGFMNDNIPQYNSLLVDGINDAFTHKGMFNDFVHWHRAITVGEDITLLEDLYSLIHSTVNGRNAWYTGFGESMEYLWFRRMTQRAIGTVVGSDIHVVLDYDDELNSVLAGGLPLKILYETIKTPLTVKVDLTGTVLAGKNIVSSFSKPVSLGSNVYLVDVPFGPEKEGIKGVVLRESVTGNYFSETKPTASAVFSGSNLTVTSDEPIKAVLFSGDFTASIPTPVRKNDFALSHTFSGISGTNYMVGIINGFGISDLIEL